MTNLDIVNNIFVSPPAGVGINQGGSWSSATNVIFRNNLAGPVGTVTNATISGVTVSGSRNNNDPLLANVGSHDYTLTSTSPAIKAGVTISSVTVDFAGAPRPQGSGYDIGAYEGASSSSDTAPQPLQKVSAFSEPTKG